MKNPVLWCLALQCIFLTSCGNEPGEISYIKENSPFTYNAKGKIKSTTIYTIPDNDTTGRYEHVVYTIYDRDGKPIIINDTLPASKHTISRHIQYKDGKIAGWQINGGKGEVAYTATTSWNGEYTYTATQVNTNNFINYKTTVSISKKGSLENISETFFDSSGIIYDAYKTYGYNNEGNVTTCSYEKGINEGSTSRFTINDIDNHGNTTLLTESSGDGLINRSIRIHYEYYE